MPSPKTLLSLCALSTVVAAQTSSSATITNGPATYTQAALPTNDTATAIGIVDVLSSGGSDILYQHWWFFRIAGDPREYAFKDDGTATRAVNAALSGMVTAWTDVDTRGLFAANLIQDLFTTSPQGAFLSESLTITNLTAAQLDIDLFAYTDFDVAGPGTDRARGNLSSQVIVDASNMQLSGEFLAVGNSNIEVGAFASIRTELTDATVDNLAGWSGTFGPADYTGAFQWTLQIPAFGSATVIGQLATLDCRPDTIGYGTGGGGTSGIPTIASDYPVLRTAASTTGVRVANGLPNSLAALALNLNPTNQTLFGINLLVEPNGISTLFAPTSATGDASFTLTFPARNPAFWGVNFFLQGLVADAGAANGLASSTAGLRYVLGGW